MAITRLKSELQKGYTNEIFLDPITHEFADVLFVTPAGYCYDSKTLQQHWEEEARNERPLTCPYTREPLDTSLLIKGADFNELNNIIAWIKAEKNKSSDNESDLSAQLQKLTDKTKRFEEIIASIKKMHELKEHWQLNINNAKHLEFWNQQKSIYKTFSRYEKISKDGRDYFIPVAIAQLMRAANASTNPEQLKEAIKFQRQQFTTHTFFFHLRSPAERILLETLNLEEIDLRPKNTYK